MKSIRLSLLVFTLFFSGLAHAQLTIINQDYQTALKTASRENKMLFIDFYTTWCTPCKALDKLVFRNDSIGKILGRDFILLQYNAEKDTVFHLSKKYHIFIYPSAVILNKNGYVVDRNYGFPGEDFPALSKSVLDFTNQGAEKNRQNLILKGYSNKIDLSNYPTFYTDYIDRKIKKVDPAVIKTYFNETHDLFSEEYFSTLLYHGSGNIPENIQQNILNNRKKLIDLYGDFEVRTLLWVIVRGKLDEAITRKNHELFDDAVFFIVSILDDNYASAITSYKKEFLKAENKWGEVFTINEDLKNKGGLSEGAISNFCWEVYKKCDDQQVIGKCIQWMKELTTEKSDYNYLDTYAHLLYKSGNKIETKKVAHLALEATKKANESTKELEKLLEKI